MARGRCWWRAMDSRLADASGGRLLFASQELSGHADDRCKDPSSATRCSFEFCQHCAGKHCCLLPGHAGWPKAATSVEASTSKCWKLGLWFWKKTLGAGVMVEVRLVSKRWKVRLVGGRWGFLRIVAGERIVKLLDIPVTPAQVAFSSERLGGPTLQIMLSSQSHSLFGNGFLSFVQTRVRLRTETWSQPMFGLNAIAQLHAWIEAKNTEHQR